MVGRGTGRLNGSIGTHGHSDDQDDEPQEE